MVTVPVGPWRPDMPSFQHEGSLTALNVVPGFKSYKPFKAFAAFSATPLGAQCFGAAFFRAADNVGFNFAGDATKLYLLTGDDWGDVSVMGGYTLGSSDKWFFTQFGSLVIAANGTDALQQFDIDADSAFTNLGGSSPTGAQYVAAVGDFCVAARTFAGPTTVFWSAINDAEDWVAAAATQSDSQVIPDGGWITGLVGGEVGVVLQEHAIRLMTFEGPPLIFRFTKVQRDVGCSIPGSVAVHEDQVFFAHTSGLFVLKGGQLIPIGFGKVDDFFWADIDRSYYVNVSAAVDPSTGNYLMLYPGSGNVGGLPNRLLLFSHDIGEWSIIEPSNVELIYASASGGGYTLAGLDVVSGTLAGLPFPLGSVAWKGTGQAILGGFNTTHNSGFFDGANMAATVDTTEAQLFPGKRAFIRQVRPAIEGGTPSIAIGERVLLKDTAMFGSPVTMDAYGNCPVFSNSVYHRGRITLPAGDTWTHVRGLDGIEATPAGSA